MGKRRIFISFDHDDTAQVNGFLGLREIMDGLEFYNHKLDRRIMSTDADYVKRVIREEYIKPASVTVVLIGNRTAQSNWAGQSHYKWPCDKSLARYLWSHPALSRLVWMPALVVLSCWSRLSAMWRITAIFSGPCPRRMRD